MAARNKIFVGSLPPSTKPEEIRLLFENYGVVTECDVMNRCAFVHMQSPDMADNAIAALHNTAFKGATINVERGRSKNPSSAGPGGASGGGGGGGGFRGGPRGGGGFRGDDRSGGPMRGNQGRGNFRNEPYGARGGGGGGGGRGGYENQSGGFRGGFNRGGRGDYGAGNDRNGGGGGGGGAGGGRGGGGGGYNAGAGGGRFSSGGQQFNSEDRRGFALPNEGAGGGGAAPTSRFSGAGRGATGQHGGLAISIQNDPYTRRSAPVDAGGQGYANRGGYSQGNGTSSYQSSSYNQAFPPLGSEQPRVNRGPPQQQQQQQQQRWAN